MKTNPWAEIFRPRVLSYKSIPTALRNNMTTPLPRRLALAAIIASCGLYSSASAGELFLLGYVNYSYAEDSSDDGQVVVGTDPLAYWYWTQQTGVVRVPNTIPPGNGVGGQARVTADGTRMTCTTNNPDTTKGEATIYHIDTSQYQLLGSFGFNCDAERSGAWGMSPDGNHVVGLAWNTGCSAKGFDWNAATNVITPLGTTYFFKPTRANAVSDNGNLIAGWADDYNGWRQGAVWNKNASGVFVVTNLSAIPAGATTAVKMSEAGAVSGNGQWVYGIGRSDFYGGAAWRWSVATGVQAITPAPATANGYVVAANNDGSKVLTFYGMMGYAGSYLWSTERGYVSLPTLAQEAGVVIPDGWILNLPLGMSEDALTIVGTASGPGGTSPFILNLRPSAPACNADINNDGSVDGNDLATMLSGWGGCVLGGQCDADLNSDGVVDGNDLTTLLSGWGICP